ncbi:MAG: hypothetical protein HY326_12885 [Chloroflexi bacterium]|nr:hypothetical protein [Chloroflexota bacterium]
MIRPFGLQDVLLLKVLQRWGTQFDLEGVVLRPHSPLAAALYAGLPLNRENLSTFVLDQSTNHAHKMRGFVQVRTRPGSVEGDVIFLAPSLTHDPDAALAWEQMLEHMVVRQGQRGVQRLFARVPVNDKPATDVFRRVGFGVYVHEHIFRTDDLFQSSQEIGGIQLRPQNSRDAWGLQRLYCKAAPRLVQQTECLVMDNWDSWPVGWLRSKRDERYVLESDGEITAYLRVIQGQRGHWLKLLIHPEAYEHAQDVLRWGLSIISDWAPRPVYCSVRSYETAVQDALLSTGFWHYVSRSLMVKHTTVRSRESVRNRMAALVDLADPIPTISRTMAGVPGPEIRETRPPVGRGTGPSYETDYPGKEMRVA